MYLAQEFNKAGFEKEASATFAGTKEQQK